MTRTEFYNLTPSRQKRERFNRYADYFNSRENNGKTDRTTEPTDN